MRKTVIVPSDGVQLNVSVLENESDKAVIVVLHGGPGSGAEVVIQDEAFKTLEQVYTTVHFDQRGSGESLYDLSQGLTRDQITDDVHVVVQYARKAFPDKPVFLWGGSYGGLLGLLYLDKYPAEVDKAIITCPAVWPGSPEFTQIQFRVMQRIAKQMFPAELAQKFEKECADISGLPNFMDSPELCAYLASFERVPTGVEGLWHAHAMRKWTAACDMRGYIRKLQIPTLFLQGIEDPLCPSHILLDTLETVSNPLVSVKTFSPCGHAVFDDCKEGFCEACEEFYGDLGTVK